MYAPLSFIIYCVRQPDIEYLRQISYRGNQPGSHVRCKFGAKTQDASGFAIWPRNSKRFERHLGGSCNFAILFGLCTLRSVRKYGLQ